MNQIQKHKTVAKAQNKNPFKAAIYNMKKREKEGTRQNFSTLNPSHPIVPVDVVLFVQGSTFIVRTMPTTQSDQYYTFANYTEGDKAFTPFNWNHIQAFLDGHNTMCAQYKDMIVRLYNSETHEEYHTQAQCIRIKEPGDNQSGSYHPIVFGLPNGNTITADVWKGDTLKVFEHKTAKKIGTPSSLNHVKLVFTYNGKQYDNCFIYFKCGSSQFDTTQPKGKYTQMRFNCFGL